MRAWFGKNENQSAARSFANTGRKREICGRYEIGIPTRQTIRGQGGGQTTMISGGDPHYAKKKSYASRAGDEGKHSVTTEVKIKPREL